MKHLIPLLTVVLFSCGEKKKEFKHVLYNFEHLQLPQVDSVKQCDTLLIVYYQPDTFSLNMPNPPLKDNELETSLLPPPPIHYRWIGKDTAIKNIFQQFLINK